MDIRELGALERIIHQLTRSAEALERMLVMLRKIEEYQRKERDGHNIMEAVIESSMTEVKPLRKDQ